MLNAESLVLESRFLRHSAFSIQFRHSAFVMCERCDDTGWKSVTTDGVRRVVRCDCWREGATARLLEEARIPPRYRGCELESFVTYPNEKLLAAVRRAGRFAEDFPGGEC